MSMGIDEGESYDPSQDTQSLAQQGQAPAPPGGPQGGAESYDPAQPPAANTVTPQQAGAQGIAEPDQSQPVPPGGPQPGAAPPAAPQAPQTPQAQGPNKVASMLMGDGAAPPQTIQQTQAAVDPANTQPPGNQNLMAIQAAYEKGGPQAAIPLLQANRVAFNAKQAFAYAAMTGVPGKGPDLNAAIAAANEAEQHVLDGSNVKFAHADGNTITATVTMAGTGQEPQVIKLTPQQFKQYLHVGQDGQWDKLMETTIPATLQRLSSSNQDANTLAKVSSVQNANNPYNSTKDDMGRSTGTDTAANKFDAKYGEARTKFDPETDDELLYRADRQFPGAGQEAEKQAWIQKQQGEEAERTSKEKTEIQKGKNLVDEWNLRTKSNEAVAGTKKEASEYGADQRLKGVQGMSDARKAAVDAALKRDMGIQQRADQRNATALLRQKLAGEVTDPLTDEEKARIDAIEKAGLPGQKPAAAKAPATPQVAAPTKVTSSTPELDAARAAIAKGAPRAAVLDRLKQHGIDPTGL
jgi:hypothetical protein